MQRFKNILAYVDLALNEHPAQARGVRACLEALASHARSQSTPFSTSAK